jgi:hypothetical protein
MLGAGTVARIATKKLLEALGVDKDDAKVLASFVGIGVSLALLDPVSLGETVANIVGDSAATAIGTVGLFVSDAILDYPYQP